MAIPAFRRATKITWPTRSAASARDMAEVMDQLGFKTFRVAGSRPGRAGRAPLGPRSTRTGSKRCAVLDIVPTHRIFSDMNKEIATGYYHWLFLIQSGGLPEKMIGDGPGILPPRQARPAGARGAPPARRPSPNAASHGRGRCRIRPLFLESPPPSTQAARITARPPRSISNTTKTTWTARWRRRCSCSCGGRAA